jgi:single-strand DNA-binding protein
MAVDDGFGDNKKTIWFRCSLWGKRAESLNQYLTKGQQVVVIGRLSHDEGNPRTWIKDGETHASFEMFVSDLKLVGGKKAEQSSGDFEEELPF